MSTFALLNLLRPFEAALSDEATTEVAVDGPGDSGSRPMASGVGGWMTR